MNCTSFTQALLENCRGGTTLWGNITLMFKLDKGILRKEDYTEIFHMSTHTKILYKV